MPNFLEATVDVVSFDQIKTVLQPILDQFSVSNITGFISGIIAIGVPFVFTWWGVRKLYKAILKVATKGKMAA